MWMDLEAARDRQARVRRNLQARDGRYHGELSERDAIALHEYRRTDFPIGQKPIRIEDEVWIPNDVFIGPGVTVGKGAVVGARSTVFNDLPPGMICYGYPAKPIKPREKIGG